MVCSKFTRILMVCASTALVFSLASQASAQEIERDPVIIQCEVTPAVPGAGSDYPGEKNIIRSNKLSRPAGKSVVANGQQITIIGRVTDENCVPISNAVVDLWQTDVDGKYVSPTLAELVNPFPVFAGSGRATTDNMGYFRFDTIFPGSYGKRAPHIHLRITHLEFPTLATEMYFMGDRRNNQDAVLLKLPSASREKLLGEVSPVDPNNPEAGLKVQYDIALKGKNKYRRF